MIGVKLDEAHTRSLLDSCLITDEELASGPNAWGRMARPISPMGLRAHGRLTPDR